ncbi:hypothetical protein ACIQ6K_17605 [Streptomyces sp. NPDC096354]|uniref:hypothetical protein n=1 Tax=Streptomyces sp. NPDC096354 TaxID=3366088 RepID=UPI0037F8F352
MHHGPPAVLLAIDECRLTRVAARHDARVRLSRPVGDFVGDGETAVYVQSRDGLIPGPA